MGDFIMWRAMGDEGRAEESEGNGDDQGSDSSGRNNPVIKR